MEEGLKLFTATSKVGYNFKHVVQKLYVGSYQSEDRPPVASTSNDQTKLTLSLLAERKCSMTHKARIYYCQEHHHNLHNYWKLDH
jgi:hypothetical protein